MSNYMPPGGPAQFGPVGGGAIFDHPRTKTVLWLGLLSLFCMCMPLGVAALLVGRGALRDIANSNGTMIGQGPIKTGMVLGGISTALWLMALVFWVLVLISAGAESGTA